jgi:hypothetical protein
VNLPGHKTNSAGGAIWVLDGTLRVSGTLFDGNEAGFVGGAIYAIGTWDRGADVLVTGSTFRANQAQADPCCAIDSPTTGGALHAEDLTTLRVHQSLFLLNRADFGGAVDNYRAVVEIDGSVLRGNQSTRTRPGRGAGGAISALSADFPDPSTQNGAVNRRPARLVIAQSLLQGGSEVGTAPLTGGCVLVSGDTPRVYGGTGVPLAGSVAENRAQLEVRGTVFLDCDVSTPVGDGNGNGGAIAGDMVDLVMADSMVLDSDARGPGATGGGISLRQQSAARIDRSTFSRNSAVLWGGAVSAVGSTLQVFDSRFFRNRVASGGATPVFGSLGASILASPSTDPARPENVSGVVSGSIFSDDEGVPIADVVSNGGSNGMLYVGNRFNPVTHGDTVYINTQLASNGTNVDGLNAIMAGRGGNVAPNVRVFNPREGALRAVPSVNAVGAGAPSPTASYLAYAFVGGSAAVNGTGLFQPDGLLEVGLGDYSLTVNGTSVATAKVTGTCTAGSFLCLGSNRFRAELVWKANGVASSAQAVALSNDTGYFYFTDPANVELVVKVLDARTFNGFFWVFYGGLTNLEYTLTVTDTVTGFVRVYTNPSGRFASGGDTIAFPAASSAAASLAAAPAGDLGVVTSEASTCAGGPTALCLSGSRFRVELTWKSAGQTHTAFAVPLSGDTGYFYFLSPSNVEVIVKVLDARSFNNRFWVFYGALSNLEYTLTVTDTQTGRVKTYHNPDGTFASQGDTSAFPGP